jgi:[acyl-carrier-protein] S-malonyltransferase
MSRKKIVFIFPGQGAQFVGMGRDFFDAFPMARQTFEEADDHLKMHLSKIIFNGPSEQLTETKYSQPAIYVTSVAMLRCFPVKPAICAGLSLGEYTALFASEKLSFIECLTLVQARGTAMQDACLKTPGTMRVVLGLGEDDVSKALPKNVWIANLNCPGQVVIAGETSAMPQAEEALKKAGAKRVLPLDVSGAFHTPLMASAQEELKPIIMQSHFKSSSIELVMNVPGDFVESIDDMRTHLIAQVASPTRWEKGIRAIMERSPDLFIEIGPGKSLAGMNRKIGVPVETKNIEKVTDLEGLYAATER